MFHIYINSSHGFIWQNLSTCTMRKKDKLRAWAHDGACAGTTMQARGLTWTTGLCVRMAWHYANNSIDCLTIAVLRA